jgi:solute carrier family 35 protein E4
MDAKPPKSAGEEEGFNSHRSLRAPLAISAWFCLNISIANVNKWLMLRESFRYPVLLTTSHMIMCYICSSLYIQFNSPDVAPPSPALKRKIQILAVVFCLSIALGNIGLDKIFVSFQQVGTAVLDSANGMLTALHLLVNV